MRHLARKGEKLSNDDADDFGAVAFLYRVAVYFVRKPHQPVEALPASVFARFLVNGYERDGPGPEGLLEKELPIEVDDPLPRLHRVTLSLNEGGYGTFHPAAQRGAELRYLPVPFRYGLAAPPHPPRLSVGNLYPFEADWLSMTPSAPSPLRQARQGDDRGGEVLHRRKDTEGHPNKVAVPKGASVEHRIEVFEIPAVCGAPHASLLVEGATAYGPEGFGEAVGAVRILHQP